MEKPPFQFSLRMLLAAVGIVGIGAGLWVAEPSWQIGAVEFLLLACVPASAAALSVHSDGRAKAFWMGVTSECISAAVFCCTGMGAVALDLLGLPTFIPTSLESLMARFWLLSANFQAILFSWAFAPVVGLLCVFTHWLFIRPPRGPKG